MTIRELQKKLQEFPDNMEVYVDWDSYGDNEIEASRVTVFSPCWLHGESAVKIE